MVVMVGCGRQGRRQWCRREGGEEAGWTVPVVGQSGVRRMGKGRRGRSSPARGRSV